VRFSGKKKRDTHLYRKYDHNVSVSALCVKEGGHDERQQRERMDRKTERLLKAWENK